MWGKIRSFEKKDSEKNQEIGAEVCDGVQSRSKLGFLVEEPGKHPIQHIGYKAYDN